MDLAMLNLSGVFGGGEGGANPMMLVLMFGLMGGAMYFFSIRPQRKRQKEEQAMRDNLEIGDEITTLGGILGRVVTIKEDSLIIETGADRTRIRILRTAIHTNNTQQEKIAAEREAAQKAQQEERDARIEEMGRNRKKSKRNKDED